MFNSKSRGVFAVSSASREISIPRSGAPETAALCVWDVRLCMSLVLAVVVLVWVMTAGTTPAASAGLVSGVLMVSARRSGLRYLRIRRS